MNLVWHYDRVSKSEAQKWCKYYGIFLPRIKRLSASIDNLRKRVADFIGVHEALLKVEVPPSQMPHGKVTILRVIQVWVFHETLIQYDPERLQKAYDKKGVSLQLTEKSDQMERNHLDQVLMKDRHPFELCGSSTIQLNGTFELLASSTGKKSGANRDFLSKLEARALSYATEKGFDSVCIAFADILVVYACPGLEAERLLLEAMRGIGQEINTTTLEAKLVSGKARRGISERACGMWKVEASFEKKSNDDSETTRTWSRSSARSDKKGSLKPKDAKRQRVNIDKVLRSNSFKSVSLFLPWSSTSIQTDQSLKFELIIFNAINAMNNVDLRDLLGPGVQTSKAPRKTVGKQTIKFPLCDNSPYYYKGKAVNTGDNISNLNGVPKDSSWERPLLKCIPEGARVLSVLASSRRKEQVVKFLPEIKDNSNDNSGKEGKQKGETGKAEDDDDDLCFYLDKSANIAFRWKRFNSEDTVYVETNSVPASAVPHRGLGMMYSVCANTLELRGGSLRAEGLTLLPQGRQFLLLSRFTFGLFQQSNFADGTIYKKAVAWADPSADAMTKKLIKDRVEKAVRFHQSSLNLGEALECFPEKVVELLDIFNLVDSYRSKAWDSLDSNPFIRENLIRHKVDLEKRHPVRFYRQESSGVDGGGSSSDDGDRELERVLAATSHLDLETGTGHTSKKGEKKTNKKDKKKKEKDNNHHDKKKAKKGKSKENSKVDAKDKKAKDKKKKKEKS